MPPPVLLKAGGDLKRRPTSDTTPCPVEKNPKTTPNPDLPLSNETLEFFSVNVGRSWDKIYAAGDHARSLKTACITNAYNRHRDTTLDLDI
ncbi:hypothetical protein CSAL01_13758, partial [Colletotrichum salicis]